MAGQWLWGLLGVLAGVLLSAMGFVHLFWGNDPFFGLIMVATSGLFYVPLACWIRTWLTTKQWRVILALVFFFLTWASLGVGELDNKVELLKQSFPMPNITGI